MPANRLEIFFVCQGKISFFESDRKLLETLGRVTVLDEYPPTFGKIPWSLVQIAKSDVVFIWFMGRHAIIPLVGAKLFGKKVILVAGGWDVASCPEIDYGLMRPGILSAGVRNFFHLPDFLLAISVFNQKEILQNTGTDPRKVRKIYLGFPIPPEQDTVKENLVITVGFINENNLKRKGFENFVRLAALVPESSFVVAGAATPGALEILRQIAPPNVRFAGRLSDEALDDLFRRAAVYVQLSHHEAFGCAVAEAMLRKCIPVVSDRGALPEVVGDSGFVIPYGDAAAAAVSVRQALASPERGVRARSRVAAEFTLEKRRVGLIEQFKQLGVLQ